MATYRKGPLGSLLDEYERAAKDMHTLLQSMSQDTYTAIADPHTSDPDCRSIQTVMEHVVRSGYGYANRCRLLLQDIPEPPRVTIPLPDPATASEHLRLMLQHTETCFAGHEGITADEMDTIKHMSSWGCEYSLDQWLEHAIVHILRHRRQIERFMEGVGRR